MFINVGRGDLVRSGQSIQLRFRREGSGVLTAEDILAALNAPTGLFAVALDVTDPEPLGEDHPLWTHPRAIVTPHTSGDFDGYFDAGADLLAASVQRFREEQRFINVIDPAKGY